MKLSLLNMCLGPDIAIVLIQGGRAKNNRRLAKGSNNQHINLSIRRGLADIGKILIINYLMMNTINWYNCIKCCIYLAGKNLEKAQESRITVQCSQIFVVRCGNLSLLPQYALLYILVSSLHRLWMGLLKLVLFFKSKLMWLSLWEEISLYLSDKGKCGGCLLLRFFMWILIIY